MVEIINQEALLKDSTEEVADLLSKVSHLLNVSYIEVEITDAELEWIEEMMLDAKSKCVWQIAQKKRKEMQDDNKVIF